MKRVGLSRKIPFESSSALHEELKAKFGEKFLGVGNDENGSFLMFHPTFDARDENTALQIANGFDITKRSQSELAEEQQRSAYLDALEVLKAAKDGGKVLAEDKQNAIIDALIYLSSRIQ